MRCLSLILICILSAPVFGSWTPTDLLKLKEITRVTLSPDGQHVLYAFSEAIVSDTVSKSRSQIWIARADGSDSRWFADGSAPRFSPDGHWVAFNLDEGGQSSLWLCPTSDSGGHALISRETSITHFRWAPDSQSIAFIAVAPPSEQALARKKSLEDGVVVDQEVAHSELWVIDLAGNSRRLAAEPIHFTSLSWSPDSALLAVACQPSRSLNTFTEGTIALVDLHTGKMTPLVNEMVAADYPYFSPDGEWVAFTASDAEFPWAFPSQAYLVSVEDGEPIRLASTPDEALQLAHGFLGWVADGSSLVALEQWGTLSCLYLIPTNGNPVESYLLGNWVLSNAAMCPDGRHVGCVAQNLHQPPEAALIDLATQEIKLVSQINQHLDPNEFGRTEVVRWISNDGLEIEGLLTYPLGYEKGECYPLIAMIHGGPPGIWQQHFFRSSYPSVHPVSALSAHGYAVLQPNVRGSQGYGKTFRFANRSDWGGGDFADLMSGIDHVVQLGIADPDRLGVMGWSYGGYLSAWAITQTDRFKAASVGAGVVDLISMGGTCDIPNFLPDSFDGEVWEKQDLYIERSPVHQLGQVTTPTLILHGENDERCPVSQGYELFTLLKRRGVPVEMVVYPRTGHTPTEPKICVDIIQRNLDWFDRHLKP